jgi:hypothetical protein
MATLPEGLASGVGQEVRGGPKETSWDVLILGAGASGLMCAIEAGKRGRRVLVLDHGDQPGRKIRLAGGGRANFTNRQVGMEHYQSANPRFALSALKRFPPSAILELLERHGFPYEEKSQGRLFGHAPAARIVEILLDECQVAGVRFGLGQRIDQTRQKDGLFRVQTAGGTFLAPSLVVATGGCSYPQAGASDFGHRLAAEFGLEVIPPRPGLVGLLWDDHEVKRFGPLAGLSILAEVRCRQATFRDGLLFTHRGLSGPAILQASSYWPFGERLYLNLAPDRDLTAWLIGQKRLKPRSSLGQALNGLWPARLAAALVEKEERAMKLGALADHRLEQWAKRFTAWPFLPARSEGMEKAEVTVGGVDTRGLSSRSMESRRVKGLFFTGEVMDVTGQLGGYNLHWAWASGFCAGHHV